MNIRHFCAWFFTSILGLSTGCTALPNVSAIIDDASTAQSARQLVSVKGVLSPKESRAIMERLKKTVAPTDILARHTVVVESVTDSPLTKGNHVTLLADGQATYAAMFKAIENGRDHINCESYIIEDDETGQAFADLLLQKQAEGVQVNLISDSFGSMNTPASFFQRLREGGVEIVEFNPINPMKAMPGWGLTHRNHRKILIVDGQIAIIGGINISKVYSSNPLQQRKNQRTPIHWRDTDVEIKGQAVAELQKLFLDTWHTQQGSSLSEGNNYYPDLKGNGHALVRVVGSTPGQTNRVPFVMYVSAITFAEHSIHLTHAYFIPDKQIVKALAKAAERGVDVKIILPGISDSRLPLYSQRHHYAPLLRKGVKIYEHKTSLLHAKTAVIDGVWSTIGSTNMDSLSMLHNNEVNAVILDKKFAQEMERMFSGDIADSEEIHWDQWKKRPLLPRTRDWFVNLFARWL